MKMKAIDYIEERSAKLGRVTLRLVYIVARTRSNTRNATWEKSPRVGIIMTDHQGRNVYYGNATGHGQYWDHDETTALFFKNMEDADLVIHAMGWDPHRVSPLVF